MQHSFTIKINFKGGLISPGDLLLILKAAKKAGTSYVSFGLRQQLLIEAAADDFHDLVTSLKALQIDHEVNADVFPNIISSYPAEEVFISKTWLSEGVYKDIFDSFEYKPTLKINVSDSNQSFTPLLTGNINWVASSQQHFWHLVIRFPKTNIIYHWKDLVYTNDIAAVSKKTEQVIQKFENVFYDNKQADGNLLYDAVMNGEHYITSKANAPLQLPPFMLPYYEGFNKIYDKYWLGIYRRDELFSVKFLQDVCNICLSTKIGQICSTPWKSLIIKGIEEKDRHLWNEILGKHQVNVRHAANELNFQVEDNCKEGLDIKSYLVKHLNNDDSRTFGICIGIKTRKKSEVFSNILVRKKSLFTIAGIGFFNLYDLLFAEDFNPNERTGKVFSRNNIKFFVPEQLRLAIVSFYNHKAKDEQAFTKASIKPDVPVMLETVRYVHQCKACLSIYDDSIGELENGVAAGTSFDQLPANYCCATCDEDKNGFVKIAGQKILLSS
jgi:rubredoxin